MKHKLTFLVVAIVLVTASPGVQGASLAERMPSQATSASPLRAAIEASLADGPVVLFFHSPQCEHCTALAPAIAELERDLRGTATLVRVDLSAQPEEAYAFGVTAVPALLVVTAIEQDEYTYIVVPSNVDSQDLLGMVHSLRPVRTGYCSSCSDCSTKLASGAYDVVKLTTNLKQVGGACVSVILSESNVTFDCDGHFIDGDDIAIDPEHGVAMMHGTNNTVRNCTISDFTYGIYLWDTTDHRVMNNTLASNGIGLNLGFANSTTVQGNVIDDNYTGINISYSDNNAISGNQVCDNEIADFNLSSGAGNSGDGNTCDSPGFWNDTGTTGCSYSCGVQWLFLPIVLREG